MGGGVEQAAVILLAMHFQQQATQILEQAHPHRLVIDEGAGFAVGGKAAAQHDLALAAVHRLFAQHRAGGMVCPRIEYRRGGTLARAGRTLARPRLP